MPRKSETVAINNPKYDRRVKLTNEQKEIIRHRYQTEDTSYNKLAVEYGVSKRLISFIIHPEKEKISREQMKLRQKDGRYYDKDKHAKYVREYRKYKDMLYKKGKI